MAVYDTDSIPGYLGGQAAVKQQYADACCNQATTKSRPSVLQELNYAHADAGEQHERRGRAIAFLAKHPEFDDFITLIRTGCIHI